MARQASPDSSTDTQVDLSTNKRVKRRSSLTAVTHDVAGGVHGRVELARVLRWERL